jgi:dTDP-D-glucose 4,6-dehydratase
MIADYFRRSIEQESRIVMISGNSEEPTVLQVLEDLKNVPELAGFSKEFRFTRDRPFNDRRYYSARDPFLWDTLGWRSLTSWDQGLRETVRYYTQCDDT